MIFLSDSFNTIHLIKIHTYLEIEKKRKKNVNSGKDCLKFFFISPEVDRLFFMKNLWWSIADLLLSWAASLSLHLQAASLFPRLAKCVKTFQDFQDLFFVITQCWFPPTPSPTPPLLLFKLGFTYFKTILIWKIIKNIILTLKLKKRNTKLDLNHDGHHFNRRLDEFRGIKQKNFN